MSVACVALHRPSRLLAVAFESGSLDLHVLGAGSKSLDLHAGAVLCAVFSPEGSLLLTGGTDGRICMVGSGGSDSPRNVGTVSLASQGATSGANGIHIESIAVGCDLWLAPVGHRVAFGQLSRRGEGWGSPRAKRAPG